MNSYSLQEAENSIVNRITEALKTEKEVLPALLLCVCARVPCQLKISTVCVQELLDIVSRQKEIAFIWSKASAAAVSIQKHWKRHRAEKLYVILRRRSMLAKRVDSIKRHMERKWLWTDAIQQVVDSPPQVWLFTLV